MKRTHFRACFIPFKMVWYFSEFRLIKENMVGIVEIVRIIECRADRKVKCVTVHEEGGVLEADHRGGIIREDGLQCHIKTRFYKKRTSLCKKKRQYHPSSGNDIAALRIKQELPPDG